MISVAVRPRAAWVTALVLLAALARAALTPAGPVPSTAVFAASLGALLWMEGLGTDEKRWRRLPSLLAGVGLGVALVLPLVGSGLAQRPLGDFWVWGAATALIATLEEAVLRGPLQRRWTEEAGVVPALILGALVFAAIHLPRYGIGALPLDGAVGLALGGLRVVCGRILPCALAHVIADWGAWFLV